MSSQHAPAALLALTAAGFAIWALVIIRSPGGSIVLEWIILVAAALLVMGVVSLKVADRRRATLIRRLLTGFAIFGAVVVIGFTADDSSSRTWFRLGWAALLAGLVTAQAAWWAAPGVNRRTLLVGGVVGAVVIAAGAGIAINCNKALQRSWCDPVYEQEEALAARSIEVARGRYTAGSGPYSNCQVDVKVEVVPAGNLETLNVACTSAG